MRKKSSPKTPKRLALSAPLVSPQLTLGISIVAGWELLLTAG